MGADEEDQQFQNAGSSGVAVVDDAKAESVEKSHLESEAEEKMHLEMEASEVAMACIEAETAEKDRLGTEAADLAHAKAVSIEKSHRGSEAEVKMHLATNTRDILDPAQNDSFKLIFPGETRLGFDGSKGKSMSFISMGRGAQLSTFTASAFRKKSAG